jgi:hypothetical protein
VVPGALSIVHQCQCRICHEGSDPEIMEYHHTINLVLSRLTEPQRRWYVAALAQGPHALGLRQLVRITGLDRNTIRRGCRELADGFADLPANRQRRLGGGQPAAEKKTRGSKP